MSKRVFPYNLKGVIRKLFQGAVLLTTDSFLLHGRWYFNTGYDGSLCFLPPSYFLAKPKFATLLSPMAHPVLLPKDATLPKPLPVTYRWMRRTRKIFTTVNQT